MLSLFRANTTKIKPTQKQARDWRPLAYFNLYRLALSLLFLILFLLGPSPSILGSHSSSLFLGTAIFYVCFSVFSVFTIRRRKISLQRQAQTQVLIDIIALTLLMHSSGGLTSGIGILIAIAIAGSSIILAGRQALLYAAIASLAVLGEQVYAHLMGLFSTTAYTLAGILGTTFFATALLAHVLATRIRESEALAAQRGIDLANMERLNEYIIQHMDAGIIVVDENGRTRLVNESAWYLLGMPAMEDNTLLNKVSPELADMLLAWVKDPGATPKPFRAHSDSADILPKFTTLGRAPHGGVLILLEDSSHVTQQVQQMKLASLGRLTASIAHEIRNPLGAISHAAQLLAESPSLDKADLRLAEIIQSHSVRMNHIVENILQLSRRERSHPEVIELKAWTEDFAEEFCSTENLSRDQLTVDIHPENVTVQVDTSQLQQILWNLCTNAAKYGHQDEEAVRIVIRGGITEESMGPFLDIIDFGKGIDPEVAQQMFEPFFTTGTESTGLGLYITRELCECNKARLAYHAIPTGGSCFRINFPDPKRITL